MTKAKNEIKVMSFKERNKLSHGYVLRKKINAVLVSICRGILLFGLCFLILQPMFNKISVSFMTEADLYDPTVISIPQHFTTENYKRAASLMEYGKAILNSTWVSLSISALQIIICTLVGYGFARFKFPLKKFWFGCVMMTIIVPPQVISSSLYLHFNNFDIFGIIKAIKGETINLRGSVLPYFLMSAGCVGLKNGLYIYMVRQYFRTIPVDMEEAAYIDGCGTLKTFFRIMLPQAKPIITSCFLFAFVWQWTDGFYSKMFLGGISLVGMNLARIVDALGALLMRETGVRTSVSIAYSNCILSTGVLMIVMPVIMIYLIAQRQFVESLSSTGIKM